MHKYHSAWLGSAHAALTDEVAKSRWEGVVHLATEADRDRVIELVALAYGLDSGDSEAIAETVQAADTSFPMVDNAFVMRAVSASAVAHLFLNFESKADAAALVTRTLSLRIGSPGDFRQLSDLGAQHLSTRARRVRSADMGRVSSVTAQQKEEIAAALADAAASIPDLQQAASNAAELLADHLGRIAANHAQAIRVLANKQEATDEANDILWWITTDGLSEGEALRSDFSSSELAIISGAELAALVRFPVAPAASSEFLKKVVSAGKASTRVQRLESVLSRLPDATIQRLTADLHQVPATQQRFLPVLSTVAKQKSALDSTPTADELAQVVLSERLLARHLGSS